jgi:ribosomal protein S18 acetylase RimI-like enzyme
MIEIRFLDDVDPGDLHDTFLRAFSDYVIPMNLNRRQFLQLLQRRGTENDISVAAFDDGISVGFTFNAFELYDSIPTAYDVVTGIVPEARRRGIAQKMFNVALPKLKMMGAKKYILEVFENNLPALRLYEQIGFSVERKLEVFTRPESSGAESRPYRIREIEPDWELLKTFWDWQPSWQNSIASIERSQARKTTAGIFEKSELIGYGVVFPETADIPQFAIHPAHRRKGAGAALLDHLQSLAGTTVRVVNVDGSSKKTIRFLQSTGFTILGRQNEMHMILEK